MSQMRPQHRCHNKQPSPLPPSLPEATLAVICSPPVNNCGLVKFLSQLIR